MVERKWRMCLLWIAVAIIGSSLPSDAVDQEPALCPTGWSMLSSGSRKRCIKYFPAAMDFVDARANCGSGNSLAIATSQAELNDIYAMCTNSARDCWIGHQDSHSSTDNVWTTVDPDFSSAFISIGPGFDVFSDPNEPPWLQFEPDNGILPTVEHDCAKLALSPGTDAKVMDDNCEAKYASVCQTRALCASGTYRFGFMCRPCPAGKYNPTPTTSVNACRNCPAGRYGSLIGQASSECSGLCNPGHYCPGGQTAPDSLPCPAGRYGQSSGLATSSCSGNCQGGFYCEKGETSSSPSGKKCAAGKYGNPGATTSACSGDCESGFFCPEGSASRRQHLCGRNATNTAQWAQCPDPSNPSSLVDCKDSQYCPRGSGAPLTALPFYATYGGGSGTRHSQSACPRGTWCPNGAREPCAAGRYGLGSNEYENDLCEGPCAAGYQCPAGSSSPSPFECARNPGTGMLYAFPRNYYCPPGTGASQEVPVGQYSLPRYQQETTRTGSTACIADHACIQGYTDLKIEYTSGCDSWDTGSDTGDRRWKGEARFHENSDAESVEVSLFVRPPARADISWTVVAECQRWSSQTTPNLTMDFSSLFAVSVRVSPTTSIYTAPATATVRVAPGKYLNYEVCEKFSTRVVATIQDTSEAVYQQQTFTCRLELEVQDTNDAPFFPGELGQVRYVRHSPEAVRANTPVGEPVEAADEDVGQEHTYSITSGNEAGMFGVTRCGGQLYSINGALDFETVPIYNLTITVADSADKIGGALTGETEVTVLLTNVNERPFFNFEPQDFFVQENMPIGTQLGPGEVNATDPDGDKLVLAVTILDSNLQLPAFRVENGTYRLLSNVELDYERKESYRLLVTISDGEFEEEMDSNVAVIDMNDPPVFVRKFYTFSVIEDRLAELSGESITASDPDATAVIAMAIVQGNSDNAFKLVGSGASQTLALNSPLDYEAVGGEYRSETIPGSSTMVYRPLLISASDGENTVVVPVNVTVRNINERPSLDPVITVHIDEELDVGSITGVPLGVTDPEILFQTFSWQTVSHSSLPFELEFTSGRLRILSRMDYESAATPLVCTIRVNDNGVPSLSDTSELRVFLKDINEKPFFVGTLQFVIPENSPGLFVVGHVAVDDVDINDGKNLTFSQCASGDSSGSESNWDLFSLLENGTLVVNSNVSVSNPWRSQLDFERGETYTLCLNVTDSGNGHALPLSAQSIASISLADQNEPPRFVQSSFTVGVNDGSPAGTLVGSPLQVADQDAGSVHSFVVVSGNVTKFDVTARGQFFAASAVPTLSTTFQQLEYTVRVSDQFGLVSEATVSVRITNANQAPTIQNIPAQQVNEHSLVGLAVYTVTATDPDSNDTVEFSLAVDPPQATEALQIDSTSGEIKVSSTVLLDRELQAPYKDWRVTVFARDVNPSNPNHASLMSNATFVLIVTNINEPPSISTLSPVVLENSIGDTGGSVYADDVDFGETLTYSLLSVPSDYSETFELDATTGTLRIRPGRALDFEAVVDKTTGVARIAVTVLVMDAGGLSDSATVTIDVLDVNEPPSILGASGFILEGQSNTAILPDSKIGNLSIVASDPDLEQVPNGEILFAVVASWPPAPLSLFQVVVSLSRGLSLVVTKSLDFEDVSEWVITVQVSDGGSPVLSEVANFTIMVGDVNDAVLSGPARLYSPSGAVIAASPTSGGVILELQGSNLGYTQRRINSSRLTPTVQARFSFSTAGAGSLLDALAECYTLPSFDSSSMVVRCTCPPGIGQASVTLQILSPSENSSSITPNSRAFEYAIPAITSIAFASSKLSTEGGEQVTIVGSNFGPANYSLPPFPVKYRVAQAGSTTRLATNCQYLEPHTILQCMTVPGVGAVLQWVVSLAGKDSSWISSTTGYAPPHLLSLSTSQSAGLLNGGGGDTLYVSGVNFGNAVVYLLYRNVSGRFRYKTAQCTFTVLHRAAECLSVGGSGVNHHVEIVVGSDADGWTTSHTSQMSLSYAAPQIQLGGVSGPGVQRADTRGGQIITIIGNNFGAMTPISTLPFCGAPVDPTNAEHTKDDPTLAAFDKQEVPTLFYGPTTEPRRYEASNCIVVDRDASVVECCSSPGTGSGFVFQVELDGQTSEAYAHQLEDTGFHPPIVQELRPTEQGKWSDGGGQMLIRGEYFGDRTQMIDSVVYGQGDANGTYEFQATGCLIDSNNPHTQILCLTDQQAGQGLGWSVRIDGQQSELAKTNYAPPTILGFDRTTGFSTRGGELIQLYGRNFGPQGNRTQFFESATYSGGEGHTYAGEQCVVQTHEHITCITSPGTGSKLRWEVSVAQQTSPRSVETLSYNPPQLVTLSHAEGKPTVGQTEIVVWAKDLAALDPTVSLRVHFQPRIGLYRFEAAVAELAPAPNTSLDKFSVSLAPGWGQSCQMFVSLHLKNANLTQLSQSLPVEIDYDPPALLSIQLEPPTDSNNKYTATLNGDNFGKSTFFGTEPQPVGFVTVFPEGKAPQLSYCAAGSSSVHHCVNPNASVALQTTNCSCPLKILSWNHKTIKFETAFSRGNLSVNVFKRIGSDGQFEYHSTAPLKFEASAPSVISEDKPVLEARRFAVDGGDELYFRMEPIDNQPALLRIFAGYNQFMPLEGGTRCFLRPCVVQRSSRSCSNIQISNCERSRCDVSCTMPPGQGRVQMVAEYAGKPSTDSVMPLLTYDVPAVSNLRQVNQSATQPVSFIERVSGDAEMAWKVQVPTSGSCFTASGSNFGDAKYWSFVGAAPWPYAALVPGQSSPPLTYLAGLHLASPTWAADPSSTTQSSFCVEPFVQHIAGDMEVRLFTGVGYNRSENLDDYAQSVFPGAVERYKSKQFFGGKAQGTGYVRLSAQSPTVEPVQLTAPTRGGVVFRLEGENFGAELDNDRLIPKVLIGNSRECKLLTVIENGILYKREQLAPSSADSPHRVITCLLPEGVGRDKAVSLQVGHHIISNKLGTAMQGVVLHYLPPQLMSVSPQRAPTGGGQRMILSGTNFGDATESIVVHFLARRRLSSDPSPHFRQAVDFDSSVRADSLAADLLSHEHLEINIPPGQGETKQIVIEVAGQRSESEAQTSLARPKNAWPLNNATSFEYDAPKILRLERMGTCGTSGCQVTISGENFGLPVEVPAVPSGLPQELRARYQPHPIHSTLVVQIVDIDVQPIPRMCITTQYSHNQITCSLKEGVGQDRNITLSLGQHTVTAPIFSYAAPIITDIVPNVANAAGGRTIRFTGDNFGPIYEEFNFDLMNDWMGTPKSLDPDPWRPPINILISNSSCADARVFASHIEAQCTFGETFVGPAMLAMDVAGVQLRQSPQALGGLLQFTCERGFYGQVGEKCIPCPIGSVCDFNGRYDCASTNTTLCTGDDCNWYAPLFCRGNDDCFSTAATADANTTAADSRIEYENRICVEYPEPIADASFWRDDKDSSNSLCDPQRVNRPPPYSGTCPTFLKCEPSEACLGNNTCAAGYTDFRCSKCAAQYYRFDGECKPCPDRAWLPLLMFVCGIMFIGAFGFWLNRKNINLALMSISVDYVQVLGLFARSKIEWPQILKDLFSYMSFFNFNLDLTAPECLAPSIDYRLKWVGTMVLPMAVFFLLLSVYLVGNLYMRYIRRLSRRQRTAHKAPTVGAGLTLSYFMYLYVSRTVLDIFNCSPTDPPDDWKPGYMQADFIPCYKEGGTHLQLLPYAYVFLFVYVMAYPIAIYAWLRRSRHIVKVDQLLRAYGYGHDEKTSDRLHYQFRRMFHKVYYHFKPGKWYWITVIISRKFFIAITALLFRSTPGYQLAMIVLVLFASYSVHIRSSPFMSRPEHRSITLAHELRVEESDPYHLQLDASLQPLLSKAQRADRSDFRQATFGAEKKRGADLDDSQLMTNYNTVESVLLVSAILVALSGIMFNSKKMVEMDTSPAKDALTMLVLIIILASVAYFVVIFAVEIVETIGDDPLCCCHCIPTRPRRVLCCVLCGPCHQSYRALRWTHDKYLMSQSRKLGVHELEEMVKGGQGKKKRRGTDSQMNPMAALALMSSSSETMSNKEETRAMDILSGVKPPSQAEWLVAQQFLTARRQQIDEKLPEQIKRAKRGARNVDANKFAKTLDSSILRSKGPGRRQFAQKSRALSSPKSTKTGGSKRSIAGSAVQNL